jgi:3-methyladenine DNA glycosylase AlkD
VSEAADFIDLTLRNEGDWYRAQDSRERFGGYLDFYGASVGAVRGTVRDALRKFPGLGRDEVAALASELWGVPVLERRLAAVVLLQSRIRSLDNSDLTRLEGFVRTAGSAALVDPLAADVIRPLIEALDEPRRTRADAAIARWAREPNEWLRRAAAAVSD